MDPALIPDMNRNLHKWHFAFSFAQESLEEAILSIVHRFLAGLKFNEFRIGLRETLALFYSET